MASRNGEKDYGTDEISMEYRLQAVMPGNKVNRLKAVLHTYFVCFVILFS